jgi:hypothetical protein
MCLVRIPKLYISEDEDIDSAFSYPAFKIEDEFYYWAKNKLFALHTEYYNSYSIMNRFTILAHLHLVPKEAFKHFKEHYD